MHNNDLLKIYMVFRVYYDIYMFLFGFKENVFIKKTALVYLPFFFFLYCPFRCWSLGAFSEDTWAVWGFGRAAIFFMLLKKNKKLA